MRHIAVDHLLYRPHAALRGRGWAMRLEGRADER